MIYELIIIIFEIIIILLIYLSFPKIETFENDIPIDLVYTWVDGNDENWIKKKNFYFDNKFPKPNAYRYKNIEELKYSLRSIEKYAPWIRNIFVVVDDEQFPPFIDDTKVKIIKHSDIFINNEHLPTFNSQAIESNLHRIPGLSDIFIYLNDDCFFANKIHKSDIIAPNGKPYYFYQAFKFKGPIKPNDNSYKRAWKNNYRILKDFFPNKEIPGMWHQGIVLKKSVIKELENRIPEDFYNTSNSKFRAFDNIAPMGLCYIYGYLSGEYELGNIPTNMFFNFNMENEDTLKEKITYIQYMKPKFICINNIEPNNPNSKLILDFFNENFPNKSIFEK